MTHNANVKKISRTRRLICSNIIGPAPTPYQRRLTRREIDRASEPHLTVGCQTGDIREAVDTERVFIISDVVEPVISVKVSKKF